MISAARERDTKQLRRKREDYSADLAKRRARPHLSKETFPKGGVAGATRHKPGDIKERSQAAPVLQDVPERMQELEQQFVLFAKRPKAEGGPRQRLLNAQLLGGEVTRQPPRQDVAFEIELDPQFVRIPKLAV